MVGAGLVRWGIVLLGLVPQCTGVPPPVPRRNNSSVDHKYVIEGLHNSSDHAGTLHRLLRVSLKSRYVNQHQISQRDTGGYRIRVDATFAVSDHALDLAAKTIQKMVMYMPVAIFQRLASTATVGVFTQAETMSVYPEFYSTANPPECCAQDNVCCSGTCHDSCTFDGRKWFHTAGAGGRRAVIVDDNVLCNANDVYGSQSNILVHEFTHTVHTYALDSAMKTRIDNAYSNAQSKNLWADQYAMNNAGEYFAVATSVYFNAEHLQEPNAFQGPHMAICGSEVCTADNAGKHNLYNRDITLYGIIYEVFSSGGNQYTNIGPCTQ
ncbi:uncharacterized protein LOC127848244 isoform X1 [Dreissena polymorpha]|uniref:Lysine-specific metallo-endopeptidase domain-containing protein n=1 Tax=Dreissena polymorpha TaxID=45954 RepID=A0A9D4I6B4_DREPO|nr:uncharacterized protein LOC127848244 isoform X1 [Dreissena polymorpha]KAH3748928.1 hypothetical protein DPMN_183417 [Dreissena polymorpha]